MTATAQRNAVEVARKVYIGDVFLGEIKKDAFGYFLYNSLKTLCLGNTKQYSLSSNRYRTLSQLENDIRNLLPEPCRSFVRIVANHSNYEIAVRERYPTAYCEKNEKFEIWAEISGISNVIGCGKTMEDAWEIAAANIVDN